MRVQRRLSAAVGVSALVLLAAGCGGATAGHKPGADTSASAASAEPLPVKTTPRPATWTDTGDQRHPLRVGPKKLARGAASDMAHIRLDDDLKGMVPYYLTFSFTNTGAEAVKDVDPTRNFSVNTADGQAGHAVSLFRSNPLATSSGLPADCRDAGRAELAAGATTSICQIFMMPEDSRPATVSYRDDGGDTLLWQVDGGPDDGAKGGGSRVLDADEAADSVTQDSSRHAVTVHITPQSVRAGSVADLSRFDLDADQKKLTPYYVTMEYRNTGKYALLPDLNENVVVRTAGGQESKRMILLDIGGPGVTQCPDATPDGMLKPGAEVTSCSVHMVAEGDRPAAVVFQGKDSAAQTVTWRADGE